MSRHIDEKFFDDPVQCSWMDLYRTFFNLINLLNLAWGSESGPWSEVKNPPGDGLNAWVWLGCALWVGPVPALELTIKNNTLNARWCARVRVWVLAVGRLSVSWSSEKPLWNPSSKQMKIARKTLSQCHIGLSWLLVCWSQCSLCLIATYLINLLNCTGCLRILSEKKLLLCYLLWKSLSLRPSDPLSWQWEKSC